MSSVNVYTFLRVETDEKDPPTSNALKISSGERTLAAMPNFKSFTQSLIRSTSTIVADSGAIDQISVSAQHGQVQMNIRSMADGTSTEQKAELTKLHDNWVNLATSSVTMYK